jgi:hypothetical protein
MSGLLRRLTRRRPATADETGTATPESSEPAGAPAETPAESGGGDPVPAPADEQATQVLPATGEQPAAPAEQPAAAEQPEQATVVGAQPTEAIQSPVPVRDMPAGIDPNELADAPVASARRGKLRRRLRYLRAVRDLLLRDLGGFTYEIQRSADGTAADAHKLLIEAKTNRLAALDTEVRGLESRLGEPHAGALLREPGIGGTCPECGEIHASDAHYCARCGAPLDSKARARRDAAVAAAVHQTTSSHAATPEPAPASVLWAAGPRPEHKAEPEKEEDTHPSLATSQWLALRPHGPAEKGEDPAAKGDEAATKSDDAAPALTGNEPAAAPAADDATAAPAAGDATAAKADEPAPAIARDKPAAKADEPAATADESGDEESAGSPLSERTALWLGTARAADAGREADRGSAADAGREATAKADEATPADDATAKADEATPADDATAKADEATPADKTTAKAAEATPAGDATAKADEDAQADAPAPQTVAAKRAGARSRATAEGAGEAVKPKRPRAPRAKKPAADAPEEAEAKPKRTRAKKPAPEFASEPNGRRDEPVSPPQGDPLTSRPDQGS